MMALRTTSGAALHNLKLFCLPCSTVLHLLDMMIKLSKRQRCRSWGKPTPIPVYPLLEVWWEGFTHYLYLFLLRRIAAWERCFERNIIHYLCAFKSYLLKSPAHFFSGDIGLLLSQSLTLFYLPSPPIFLLLCFDLLPRWRSSQFH